MTTKHLAYICADQGVPVFGRKGSSVHVQEFLRAALQQDLQIDLFVTNAEGRIPAEFSTICIHQLTLPKTNGRAEREKAALANNQALIDALNAVGPFDVIYERYSLWSYGGMDYARCTAMPGLLEVNSPLIEEQNQYRELVDKDAAQEVAARNFASATHIIAVSSGVAKYLYRFPAVRDRVHVIPNGVNPTRFPRELYSSLTKKSNSFTIGFLGSLKPWHGLSNLAAAFSMLHRSYPHLRLLIVGDGPERSSLEDVLRDNGVLGSVEFAGAVDPQEVPKYLACMDVGVAPYSDQSNFYFSPLKIFEYMAASLAIVASSVGQVEEIIEDEVTGLLCPPDDSLALAAAIRRLIEDSDFRNRLGNAARFHVFRHHTWDSIVKQTLDLAWPKSPKVPSTTNTVELSG